MSGIIKSYINCSFNNKQKSCRGSDPDYCCYFDVVVGLAYRDESIGSH